MSDEKQIDNLYKTPSKAWFSFGLMAFIVVVVAVMISKGSPDVAAMNFG